MKLMDLATLKDKFPEEDVRLSNDRSGFLSVTVLLIPLLVSLYDG